MRIEQALSAAYRRVFPFAPVHLDPLVPQRLCTALLKVLPVDGAALSLFGPAGLPMVIGASCPDTEYLARLEFTCGQGPTIDAHLYRHLVTATRRDVAAGWPVLAEQAHGVTRFRSVAAAPLPGATPATATLFCRAEHPPQLSIAELHAVGRWITTTLLDTFPREPVTGQPAGPPQWMNSPTVLTSRGVMIAAGLISSLTPLTPDDALTVLRARAWASHRTADQLAAQIIGAPLRSDSAAAVDLGSLVTRDARPTDEFSAPADRATTVEPNESSVTVELGRPPTVEGAARSTPMADLSATATSELRAAQQEVDQATDIRNEAVHRARAVHYRADAAEMEQLAAAEQTYQQARRHLEATWLRHRS